MRDADKTPAQCATVQGKDSPCAAQERARIRALVDALWDEWEHRLRGSAAAYDSGALSALDGVLHLLEDGTSHE